MKKTIIIEVDFPRVYGGEVYDVDIRDYVINAIEGYTVETGYLSREFNYEAPIVRKVKFRED